MLRSFTSLLYCRFRLELKKIRPPHLYICSIWSVIKETATKVGARKCKGMGYLFFWGCSKQGLEKQEMNTKPIVTSKYILSYLTYSPYLYKL